MPKEEDIIRIMKSLGLTGNESRLYLALLKQNPATGYELSHMAGVPRSAIYAALSHLESLNLVNSVGDRPRRFIPISPEALINHYSHKIEQDLAELQTSLTALSHNAEGFHVWYIKGYDNMVLKAREIIRKSKESLYFSVWPFEILALEEEIRQAIERNVQTTIFSFSRLPEINGNIISYDLDEERLRKAWNPTIILVADHRSVIMGGATNDPGNQVVWTDHPSIMSLAVNHIILDITLAGIRLDRDVSSIVAPMMEGLRIDLDSLIEEAHPHRH